MQIAQRFGVCSNMQFLFPRQMVDQILTNFSLAEYQQGDLNQDLVFWSVMKAINENRSQKWLSGIEAYLREDETGKKLYQLSMRIAKVFDDYQIYRPDMLIDWQTQINHETLTDPVAQWQAGLWRHLVSKDPENHLAFKARFFLETGSLKTLNTDMLPSRMSLFGISALPKIFLQVFEKLSERMDINLFLLAPSNQFFFDIKSEKQLERLALNQEPGIDPGLLYYEMTNPLLSSLGMSAKEFHACLEDFNYHEPFDDLFLDPRQDSDTLLTVLQSDILNLIHRKKGYEHTPVTIAESDTSIRIHACHSPMREAQVLKDLLLSEFEKDPELAPHEIIVMMPDIEAYAPFIESVFTLEKPLPFSISDRRKKSESEPLDAFLKILALRDSRLEQSMVLDLLMSESIARKFDISFDEISMIEKMVEQAKILWGKDADHRETLGLPRFKENTWQFGLQRLFMGMAMSENHDALVQDILPCQSFEGLDLAVLGKFAAFCHTLFSCIETLAGEKTIEKWCEALKKIWVLLMDRNTENGEDLIFLTQTVDQIREDAWTAGFKDLVTFDMIQSYIESKLDLNLSQGNFLGGNITFCNLKPMRSIPFKIIVLMGMDEKSFPRQALSPGFNLIKKYPKPGDKTDRNEDRYLFLETLLSARGKLIITYTGISIQDNSKIPCSGVVSELMDAMDQSFVFPKGYAYQLFHPLHPFNEVYFNQTPEIFSFSKDNCNIALALSRDRSADPVFIQPCFIKESNSLPLSIPLDNIIRFFRNPVQEFMKEGLTITLPDIKEQAIDREVFSLFGLDQYTLGSFLVEKKAAFPKETDFYPVFRAMGSLPYGRKGRFEYEKMETAAGPVIDAKRTIALKKQLPAVATRAMIDGLTVSANFSDIKEDGAYVVSFGKLTPARLLSGWIRHLYFNVCGPLDYPKTTRLIGRDPKGKQPLLTCLFPFLASDAHKYFQELMQIFRKGTQQPFYFFCETSWQFVQAISKNNYDVSQESVFEAMNRSKISWHGGLYQTGEKENRYIDLCVGKNDLFDSVDTLLSTGFVQNAITVYKPLLENMKILS
ncbi:MAG: exodeoxyribonuclease V subunit gamma, partial [Proteobacteria bacterium]|nr:exodeoxyribonuclease V subunit gamma [Pseudomonadota bacterium]